MMMKRMLSIPLCAALAALTLGVAVPAQPVDAVAQTEAAADRPMPEAGMIVPAADITLDSLMWLLRPVVVLANSPADPRYVQQMAYIEERIDALAERDVIVITDTDPAARSSVRQALRARDFMLVVMAKDGTIVTRKPSPWSVREISRSIDKLPLRQQEARESRADEGS
jgi:hypothetical protein